jgi:hypothetical protein
MTKSLFQPSSNQLVVWGAVPLAHSARMDWRDPDRELGPLGAALAATTARHEIGDAIVGAQLVPQRQQIDIGTVVAADGAA